MTTVGPHRYKVEQMTSGKNTFHNNNTDVISGFQLFSKRQNIKLVQIQSIFRREIEISSNDDFCLW